MITGEKYYSFPFGNIKEQKMRKGQWYALKNQIQQE
jgi:hypothetical protein